MIIAIVVGLAFLGWAILALPEVVVEVARRTSDGVVFYVETAEPVVALSIDDGPSSATPEILEVLAEHEARATFFLIGDHIGARPDLARRIVEEGHEPGHHMVSDVPSISLSTLDFGARFCRMHEILQDLDPEAPRLFRPGSGWYDDEMVAEATLHGYRVVLGSVYPFDAQISSPAVAGWYIERMARPGSIIVLHDGPERGQRTAETLRRILPHLTRRELRVVTVSELLAIGHTTDPPAPHLGLAPAR